MDKILELCAGKWKLIIDCQDKNWCKINLVNEDEEKYLGADSIKVIKERFFGNIKNIDVLEKSSFEIEGLQICRIISLSETFTTFFMTKHRPFEIFILYKDEDINNSDRINLSEQEYNVWINNMSNFFSVI